MKIDAECNETTPVTSFDRCHEDVRNNTEITFNDDQNKSGTLSNVNLQKFKHRFEIGDRCWVGDYADILSCDYSYVRK